MVPGKLLQIVLKTSGVWGALASQGGCCAGGTSGTGMPFSLYDPGGLRVGHLHPKEERKASKRPFVFWMNDYFFFNVNSRFSVFVQSSFVPTPATSSLLTALPVTLSWIFAPCFSLGLFSMPTAVSFLPSAQACQPWRVYELGVCVVPLLLLAHSPQKSILLQLGTVASVFTCGCLKGLGTFLGIQDKPTPISRSGKHLHFL